MVILLIIGSLGIGIGIVAMCLDNTTLAALSMLIGAWCLSAYLFEQAHINEPKAIDVYRGETTLEITYRDSIPIDSVVVFKRK